MRAGVAPGCRHITPPPALEQIMDFLTQAEAAQYLGFSVRTLENWRWIKRGPRYYKFEGAVRYRTSDLDQWISDSAK